MFFFFIELLRVNTFKNALDSDLLGIIRTAIKLEENL